MATDRQQVLTPLAGAGLRHPLNSRLAYTPISKTHSGPPSLPSLYNTGSLSGWNWLTFKPKSSAGPGRNVATAHATNGGAGRLDCGDGSRDTEMLPALLTKRAPLVDGASACQPGKTFANAIEIESDDESSGSARRHPPVPDETADRTENEVQQRRASSSTLPDRQSVSEPKPAAAEPRFQSEGSPSAAAQQGVETHHRSSGSALTPHHDHHNDKNQTSDRKQGDAWLPGDRGEQGVASSVTASPGREGGASIPQSWAAMSNKFPVLAGVGSSVQPAVRLSTSQDDLRHQHSLGQRPHTGTDVAKNHKPVEDGTREHGREDVAQPPPSKRRRIITSTPPAGGRITHHATPHQSQRRDSKTRSFEVAAATKQDQSKHHDVTIILGFQLEYSVKWEGYGDEANTWEPVQHFERCPELLRQFHQERGSAATRVATPRPTRLKIPKPRSAGLVSTTKQRQREYFDVEDILSVRWWYLAGGCGRKRKIRKRPEQVDRRLLQQFHQETGSVEEWIEREIVDLETAQEGRPPFNRGSR